MDLYFEDHVDDLAVPIDQEQLPDALPSSPDCWFPWGISAPYNSAISRHCTAYTNPNMEKVSSDRYRFYTEADMEMTETEGEHLRGSNICHTGLTDDTISNGQSIYQLDNLQGIDSMDDIFLGSLLEEDTRFVKNPQLYFCFSPEPPCVAGADGNFLNDMGPDSEVVSSDSNAMGSSRYLMTPSFSPSLDWDKGAIETSNYDTCNSWPRERSHIKAPVYEDVMISEHNGAYEQISEETSLEESVLHELKEIMAQLTQKTRLCFRDALYRLAHNSKQHNMVQSPNGEINIQKPSLESYMFRCEGTETTESETNVIDRAVANLMFNRMEFSQGGKHVHTAPLESEQKSMMKTLPSSGFRKDMSKMGPYLLPTSFMHDAEVPMVN